MSLIISCENNYDVNGANRFYTIVENDTILNIVNKGKIKERHQIINGIKTGFYKLYDDMENLQEEGNYLNNNKDGIIKTYKNLELKSVSYFEENKKIYDLDRDDFIYDTVKFDMFKIIMPKKWNTKINLNENVLLISQKKCDSTFVFCPSFSITKETTKLNLENYTSSALLLMSRNVDKMKLIHQNDITINGFKIILIRYIILKEGKKIGVQTGFCKISNEVFVLTGTAINEIEGEFLKYDGLFEEIILSIHK